MKAIFLIVWNLLRERFFDKQKSDIKQLNEKDILAKYIFSKDQLRANGRPRPGNMKPRLNESLSTSEVTSLKHTEVCEHGHRHVDNPSKGRVHVGYVKISYESIRRLELMAIYDNNPPRHVSIWFPDAPEKKRELAKALADDVLVIDTNSVKKYFAACGLLNVT